jgi:hypothetical protein
MRITEGPLGRTYKTWQQMKQRCLNPKAPDYARYGGRGIAVCDRWMSFWNFLADMGVRPEGRTLDRIENRQGYEPYNCRWATPAQQQQNMQSTKLTPRAVRQMRWLVAGGFKQVDVAPAFGVHPSTVSLVVNHQMWR